MLPLPTPPTFRRLDPGWSLRVSTISFVVMVLAFIAVNLIVMHSLQESSEFGQMVDQIGSQRNRAESLAKNALIMSGHRSPVATERAEREFAWTLQEMADIERQAIRSEVQKGLRDFEVRQQSSLWTPVQKGFGSLERAAVDFQYGYARDRNAVARRHEAEDIVDKARSYVRSMNEFNRALVTQATTSMEGTRRTAMFMLGMFIMTLLAQAMYIFRPILKGMRSSLAQVRGLQTQIEGQNLVLNERNRNLEDQRRVLATQQVELEQQNEQLHATKLRLEEQSAELARQNRETELQKQHLEQLAASLEAAKNLQEQAARRAEDLFQGVPVACFSFDADGVLHAWNHAAEELYGYAAFEVLWRPMWDGLGHPQAEPSARDAVSRVFDGNESSVSEWTFKRRDGQELVLQTTSFPIRDSTGAVVAGIGTSLNLTERRKFEHEIEQNMVRINEYSQELERQKGELQVANAQLSALASTDGLTGLNNHRAFQDRLEREFDCSVDQGVPLSVILADVDHFKLLNDAHGHPEGDRVLKVVASELRRVVGSSGVACRYGGEEFVAVLPGIGEEKAMEIAEAMRAAIESSQPDGLMVTASFGVASWTPTTRSRAELIAQSDKALYLAKKTGRNRVAHARDLDDIQELKLAS